MVTAEIAKRLLALHGEGDWDASEMFSNLTTMAACLGQLGAIVCDAGMDFTADDCSIRPKFRELAMRRLIDLLGTKSDVQAILGRLGWG